MSENIDSKRVLTHSRQLDALKPKTSSYTKSIGNGLFIEVTPSGAKRWRYRYTFNGKRGLLSLGLYPAVGLDQAKKKRDEANTLVAQGIDPSEQRKQDKLKNTTAYKNTFKAIAEEWMTLQTDKSESTVNKNNRLLAFAFKAFGDKPIEQITALMVLNVCRLEEAKGHLEQAQRIKSKCSQVFRYAVATGIIERDPTPDLRGALKTPVTKNRPAITDIKLIPKLLKDIDAYNGEPNTVCGLKLATLTFIRPIELRGALWADIDFNEALWRYTPPKTRNQTKLQHIVPLSRQALDILKLLHKLNGHTPYVFYSPKAITHSIMSENTINQALTAMGYKDVMCGHGFRALAKTTLIERLKYPDNITELQLAHQIKDIHGTAYNRAQFLDERIEMMQTWADYVDKLRDGAFV